MNGKKILVVDDERYMVRLVEYNLKKSGYEVVTASDGVEAMEKISEGRPDLILLDIKMPRMDGYEVCKMLKQKKETRDIPVIIVSIISDREQAMAMGARSYIMKPFSPSVLLEEVKLALGRNKPKI